MLKAYSVFIDTPMNGCLLVFSESPGQAKSIGLCQHPGVGLQYLDFSCWRVPRMDQHAKQKTPHYIESNDELPEGVTFYDDTL